MRARARLRRAVELLERIGVVRVNLERRIVGDIFLQEAVRAIHRAIRREREHEVSAARELRRAGRTRHQEGLRRAITIRRLPAPNGSARRRRADCIARIGDVRHGRRRAAARGGRAAPARSRRILFYIDRVEIKLFIFHCRHAYRRSFRQSAPAGLLSSASSRFASSAPLRARMRNRELIRAKFLGQLYRNAAGQLERRDLGAQRSCLLLGEGNESSAAPQERTRARWSRARAVRDAPNFGAIKNGGDVTCSRTAISSRMSSAVTNWPVRRRRCGDVEHRGARRRSIASHRARWRRGQPSFGGEPREFVASISAVMWNLREASSASARSRSRSRRARQFWRLSAIRSVETRLDRFGLGGARPPA